MRISIDRVRLNPVGRSLRLKGIVLTTDSLLLAKRHPGLRMFRLTAISIGGIRLTQQDGDRTPTIAEIEVSAPHVDIVRNFSDSVPPVDSLQRASGQIVRTIGIGRLRIADGSVTYCEIRNGRQTCHTLRGLSHTNRRFPPERRECERQRMARQRHPHFRRIGKLSGSTKERSRCRPIR